MRLISSGWHFSLTLGLSGSILGSSVVAAAQRATAAISGRVVTAAENTPVRGARIHLVTTRQTITTDSSGRFLFESLQPGVHQVEALVVGSVPIAAVVALGDGERKEIEFRTDTAGTLLPTVFVDGESEPDLVKVVTPFERRRSGGHGRFVTREEIMRSNPMRLADFLQGLPGIRTACADFGCSIRVNADPSNCPPAIFIDGVHTVQAQLDATLPNEVQGIEIYRGPSENPPEMNNEQARCGGIVAVWTRRGRSP